MKIEELGYVSIMRQRLGLDSSDTSMDEQILSMSPMDRVRLIAGWYMGDGSWADEFKYYFESQGIFLTTDGSSKGNID